MYRMFVAINVEVKYQNSKGICAKSARVIRNLGEVQ
ncbi:hypothetical protein CFU_0149 [Collimonas fungivorans Ter331]|uniref:Uncharacterized protein n=1 Tax=Collimonas fungivorans (strain Ter331) TaxID=1005048 RepID=G0AG96_COLFT|nr:hypothetical protein CFU_0149 [Collimonas fungivorans Ter331]